MDMKICGQGSIIRRESKPKARCRKWELQVSCGMRPDGLGYQRRARRFEGTWSEAVAAMREFSEDVASERVCTDSTVAGYLDHWHARRVRRGELAARTLDGEVYRLNAVKARIGGMKMSKVTAGTIEDMYADFAQGQTPSGKPYSPKSTAGIHKTLRAAFNQAVRDDVIRKSPFEYVREPKVPRNSRRALTKEELSRLLDALDTSNYMQLCVFLCAVAGLRRSEALALVWGDIEGDVLRVEKSLDEQGRVKPTKSGESRYIPLPGFAVDALEEERARQEGLWPVEDDWPVVTPGCSEIVLPHSVSQWWRRSRAEFGLDGRVLHELRHTYVTQLARAGVNPRTIQELAGHADEEVTRLVYTHADMGMKREAVAAMAATLDKAS